MVALWEVGTPVNTLVRSAGTAVTKRRDPGMLASAGGPVVVTKDWAGMLFIAADGICQTKNYNQGKEYCGRL